MEPMEPLDHTPNPGDRIADDLDMAAQVTTELNNAGVKTGKAGFWLSMGSMLARLGASIFGRKR